jgi:hypothetical protein
MKAFERPDHLSLKTQLKTAAADNFLADPDGL